MTAQDWNSRYAAAQQWSEEPNALAASLLVNVPPGRALDLAAGEGRMALWLAARGWRVTALDFSVVGLERGRARATELGVDVDWQVADATTVELGRQIYDLVLVLYLHLPRTQLPGVLSRAAASVAPGGRLLVLGHDQDNLERGVGGPQDRDLLYDTSLLRAGAEGLDLQRLEQVERPVGERTAVDTLLLARRGLTCPRSAVSGGTATEALGASATPSSPTAPSPRRRCTGAPRGTPRMTCSTCRQHPDHVVLPHVRHVA